MKKVSHLVVISIVLSLVALMPVKGKAQVIYGTCGDAIEPVASFDVPFTGGVHGLAFDGKNLWAAGYGAGKLYKLGFNETGEMIVEDFIDVQFDNPTGITFVGKTLYCGSDFTKKIYKIKTTGKKAGEVKDWFYAPGFPDEDCVGLTYDGDYIWNADFHWSGPEAYIHQIKIKGDLVTSYVAPGPGPEGLAFDGEFLWNVDWHQSKIYKLATDGTVVCNWDWVEGTEGNNPIGLTFDGNYLWLSDQATQKIYKIDIGQ